jgi:hypothetical protein
MDECQLKGLCYNCDDKYFLGHKCKEQNLSGRGPPVVELPEPTDITPPLDPPEVEPVISLNALTGFSAPQTLKLIGYIKHRRSSSSLTVATPIILFIVALPKKLIAISMQSTTFKS